MKNPLKKKSKPTLVDKLDEQQEHIEKWLDDFHKFRPRIERLDSLYPDTIFYTDICIGKYIHLKHDLEIPKDFISSCSLLGLNIKNIVRKYPYIKDAIFYYLIEFDDEVIGSDCDDEKKLPSISGTIRETVRKDDKKDKAISDYLKGWITGVVTVVPIVVVVKVLMELLK